jgi:hypothetical protein
VKKFWHIAGVAAVAASSWLGPVVRAQDPAAPVSRKVTNRTAFKLPLQVDDRERAHIKEIQLWCKFGPAGTWTLKESVPPTKKEFVFRAQQEGEYSFTVVTVDLAGKKNPPDVSRVPPGLVVVVDKQPPELVVHPVPGPNGQPLLQCDVRDANPDYTKTRLEYQVSDQKWQPLERVQEQPAVYRVPEGVAGKSIIRATAVDLAGNVTTQEISLQPAPSAAAAGAPAPVPSPTPLPAATTAQVPDLPAVPPPALETQSNKVTDKVTPAAHSRQVINSTHTFLNYQIDHQGPSGVVKVEVWMTRDEGQTWQKLCEDSSRRSPVAIDLPGEGSYGLSLVLSNGNGNVGAPPARGDAPDFRLEVDMTKPVARLTDVRNGTGADIGTFSISWTASDKNLRSDPIDLYYGTSREGPWLPIVKGLKNDGNYRWVAPKELNGQIYIRMEVTDEAGNTTLCVAAQPVNLDRSPPTAHILGVGMGSR